MSTINFKDIYDYISPELGEMHPYLQLKSKLAQETSPNTLSKQYYEFLDTFDFSSSNSKITDYISHNFPEFAGAEKQIRQEVLLRRFSYTQDPKNVEKVYHALASLAPNIIQDNDLYTLSNFVRHLAAPKAAKFLETDCPNEEMQTLVHKRTSHYGIFGTGGDASHTINISTIAALIAAFYVIDKRYEGDGAELMWKYLATSLYDSMGLTEASGVEFYLEDAGTLSWLILSGHKDEYVKRITDGVSNAQQKIVSGEIKINEDLPDIIKLGTGGVTGKWGSTVVSKDLVGIMPYGSCYLRLAGELGFPYSEALIAARKQIAKDGKEDIYKIIFPGSNLTNAAHVLTGFAHEEQLPHLIKLADYHEINATFVRNLTTGSDELMAGDNIIVTRGSNGWETQNVSFGNPNDPIYQKQIAEQEGKEDQLIATTNLLLVKDQKDGQRLHESVVSTIGYNIAALLHPAFSHMSLNELADDVSSFIEGQFQNPQIAFVKGVVARLNIESFSYCATLGAWQPDHWMTQQV